MKRDLDLVRAILLKVEEAPAGEPIGDPFEMDPYAPRVISEHVRAMIQAGLVEGDWSETLSDEAPEYSIDRLTWEGHDYLDAVRSDTIWKKVKTVAGEKGLTLTFEVAKTLAIQTMKAHLNLPG